MSHWDYLDFHEGEFTFSDSQNNFKYWTDKFGQTYQVTEMSEGHIRNILKMLRQGRFRRDWTEKYGHTWKVVLTEELRARGL